MKNTFLKFMLAVMTSLMVTASFNAQAWTSVAYGRTYDYVYTYTSASSKSESEKKALEGCLKKDSDCVITQSATGKDKVIVIVREAYKDGTFGIGVGSSINLARAEKLALEGCMNNKEKPLCYLSDVHFDGVNQMAFASFYEGNVINKSIYYSEDYNEGMSESLNRCKKNVANPDLCKVQVLTEFFAIAKSIDKNNVNYGIASSKVSQDEANANAMNYCQDELKFTCTLQDAFRSYKTEEMPQEITLRKKEIADKFESNRAKALKFAENYKAKTEKQAVNTNKVIARNTTNNRVNCSNSCSNGLCIRTLSDGTKERWQAPRVFDPFTQNWTWDINTNACGV